MKPYTAYVSSPLKESFKRYVLRSLVNCPKRRRSSGRINPFQTNKLVSFNIPPRPAPLCISDHVIFALEVWPRVADSAKFERNSSLGCHHMICGKTNVQAKKSCGCHGRIFVKNIFADNLVSLWSLDNILHGNNYNIP